MTRRHSSARHCASAVVLAWSALVSWSVAGEPGDAAQLTGLRAAPESLSLRGPEAFSRIVVLGERADGRLVDITARATFALAAADVAVLGAVDGEDRPAVLARGDGQARLAIACDGLEAEVLITVRDCAAPPPPSFTHDVVAGMTRAGCNSGPCHGSQYGRGGFKLSLLGYEPDVDEAAVALDAQSRRIERFDADRSLLLRKPLGEVPHEGGVRLTRGSTLHRALVRWIDAGAPGPVAGEPSVVSIDVAPAACVLEPGCTTLLLARATLSDGTVEDITGKALMSSLNDGVAAIDAAARVTAASSGETAIMVRYQGQAVVARITVPYRDLGGSLETLAGFAARNFVDEAVAAKWSELGLLPSEECTDGEFIRRVFVAAIGTLPTPDEARAFIDDSAPDKRERLVDTVLERPEYVDYWALKWGDILRIDRGKMNEKGMWSMYNWLRGELRENRPLDAMTRTLITAQGSTYTSGPTNYFRVAQRPNDLAETTSQVFLGVRLQCAQCHHHPFEKWTQADYFGLAAYFARLGVKRSSEFGVYGQEQIVYVKGSGEVRHPKTGAVVPPSPLDAGPADDPTDRRRALASWLTSSENRLFARNLANRFWGYLMGRGIVEPIDDMRVTNPPAIPALLDALADELVRSGFDQKQLLRAIMRSRVFGLSSRPRPENAGDEVFFSHYPVQRLPAEVLLDAIVAVTGVEESFAGLPGGTRAIQLPDAGFDSYFLDSFGKPKRAIACECERVSKPNMAQALHLINGDFIQSRVASKGGRVGAAVGAETPVDAFVEECYLAAFARRPTDAERGIMVDLVEAAPSRKEGFEDILWALCNASEFLFNH